MAIVAVLKASGTTAINTATLPISTIREGEIMRKLIDAEKLKAGINEEECKRIEPAWYDGLDTCREIIDEIPAVDAVHIADVKALADIALYVISKMEDFGCAYVWEKSGDPIADENNVRAECQEYRRKIKSITEGWYDAGMPGDLRV